MLLFDVNVMMVCFFLTKIDDSRTGCDFVFAPIYKITKTSTNFFLQRHKANSVDLIKRVSPFARVVCDCFITYKTIG